jgi:hypothetical protein
MATATAKKSPAEASPAPPAPAAPAPAAKAPVPGNCGTPNCTGAGAYAPDALTVTANTATGRTRTLTAAVPAGKCLPKNVTWDFGDGTRAVGGPVITHTFAGTGTTFDVVAKPQTSTRSKASAPLTVTIT